MAIDKQTTLTRAMRWMQDRGWKSKLAKSRSGQSLFEHSLIELDVLLEIQPILADSRHYGLTESEERVLAVSSLVHDVGKETETWQEYVRDSRSSQWVPHISSDLTRSVVPEACAALGFEEVLQPVQQTMAHCAEFHHSKPGRSDGAILEAMLSGGSDRFLTLAHLIKAMDQFCSAASAFDALQVIQRNSSLGNHIRVVTHQVAIKGVSTAFLHRASQAAFQQQGWRPLLYFPNATVYGADINELPVSPLPDAIRTLLKAEIDKALGRDLAQIAAQRLRAIGRVEEVSPSRRGLKCRISRNHPVVSRALKRCPLREGD